MLSIQLSKLIFISICLIFIITFGIISNNLNLTFIDDATSNLSASNTSATIMEFSRSRASPDYSFTITTSNNSHITNGKDPTGYYINIKNEGNLQDTILLTYKIINVTGGPEPDIREWSVKLNKESITLNPSDTGTIILTVESSCSCQDGTIATVRVTGESINEPTVTDYVDTYTTRGPEENEILVELDIEDVSVFFDLHPGQILSFSMVVYNYQSVSQSYTITNTKQPIGWDIKFVQEIFEVPQNSKTSIGVQTSIPIKNEPGDYVFSFRIISNYDSTIFASKSVTITLLPELTVDAITPSESEPTLGNSIELEITIKNLGQAVARDFVVNLYDSIERTPEHLINTTKVKELFGEDEITHTFTWLGDDLGPYNLTVHVDPNDLIDEVGNRIGNNIKTRTITVKKPIQQKPEDGNDNSSDVMSKYLLPITLFIIIILCSLIFIIYFFRRFRGSKNYGKSAKKIPLSHSFSRGGSGKGRKKAHKEKLTASERARIKAQDRKRRR